MRPLLHLLLLFCVSALALVAQSDTAVEPDERFPNKNYIGQLGVIHVDHPSEYSGVGNSVTLQVIVTSTGRVEYAHAVEGPPELFSEAEAIEMDRRFKPFRKSGKPVKALITDYAMVVPSEQWGTKEPFPDVKDWGSLRFTLERPEWYCEDCPAYRLEIRGDGTVLFEGLNGVPPGKYHDAISKRVISGEYQGKVSRQQVERLLEKFRQADYSSLKDKYVLPATDMETIRTSLTIDGKTKKVTDYAGPEVGMPEVVRDLEIAIDKAAVASFRAQGLNEQAAKLEADIANRH
jgi:hypothetical protein